MSVALQIIKIFCDDREAYYKYRPYIESLETDREIKLLLQLIQDYYTTYDKPAITSQELLLFLDYQYPSLNSKDVYTDVIKSLDIIPEVNPDLIVDYIDKLIEQEYANKIVTTLLPVVEGHKHGIIQTIPDVVRESLHCTRRLSSAAESLVRCNPDLADLVSTELQFSGLAWPLPRITQTVGRLKRSTLGLIYAYVDSGKTSFSLSVCAEFAKQLAGTEHNILYLGNEEDARRLCFRLTQALLQKNRTYIAENLEWADEERHRLGYDHVYIYGEIRDLNDIQFLMEQHQPRVVFIDQATNITPPRAEKSYQAHKLLFQEFRALANEFDTSLICTSQGKGEVENKKWLRMSDVFDSKVAIQGAMDYMIGIGRVLDNEATADFRYFNIAKNKLDEGNPAQFVTEFDRYTCHFKQLEE